MMRYALPLALLALSAPALPARAALTCTPAQACSAEGECDPGLTDAFRLTRNGERYALHPVPPEAPPETPGGSGAAAADEAASPEETLTRLTPEGVEPVILQYLSPGEGAAVVLALYPGGAFSVSFQAMLFGKPLAYIAGGTCTGEL